MQIIRKDVILYVQSTIQFCAICFLLLNPIEFETRFSTASGWSIAFLATALLLWILYLQRYNPCSSKNLQIIGLIFLWSCFISVIFSDASQYYWSLVTIICILFAITPARTFDEKFIFIYFLLLFLLTIFSVCVVVYKSISFDTLVTATSFYGYHGRTVEASSILSDLLPRSSGFSRSSVISAVFFVIIYLSLSHLRSVSHGCFMRCSIIAVKLCVVLIITVLAYFIILAGSRGTLLAVAFGCFMTLICLRSSLSPQLRSKLVGLGYITALSLVLLTAPFLDFVAGLFSDLELDFGRGFSGRERFWSDIINSLPIFPFGFGFNGDRFFFDVNNGLSASGVYATTASNGLMFLLISFGYIAIPIFKAIFDSIIECVEILINVRDKIDNDLFKIGYAVIIFLMCFILARSIFETSFFVAGIDLITLGFLYRVSYYLRDRQL